METHAPYKETYRRAKSYAVSVDLQIFYRDGGEFHPRISRLLGQTSLLLGLLQLEWVETMDSPIAWFKAELPGKHTATLTISPTAEVIETFVITSLVILAHNGS